MHPYHIYISGVGGQGIIKTSVIMGEAAMKKGYQWLLAKSMACPRGGVWYPPR